MPDTLKQPIIFFGTPQVAAHCLEYLINSGEKIIAAVTQPDKPVGRKQILTSPPVKKVAEAAKIPIFQPKTLKNDDFYQKIADFCPKICIIVAYGKIIPKKYLEIENTKFINLHFSLLPKYRGAAPVQRAIIDGLDETGITVQFLAEKLDCGDIILQEKVNIEINDTSESLLEKCAKIGAPLLLKTIKLILENSAPRIKQNDDDATLAPKLTKDDGKINWQKSAREIHNQVRGCYPWPGTFTDLAGKQVKIWKTTLLEDIFEEKKQPGEIEFTKKQLFVHTGNGVIEILEIQPQGKAKMSTQAFLAGHRKILEETINFNCCPK